MLRVKLEWETIFYEKGREWIHVTNKEKFISWPLMHYCCVINARWLFTMRGAFRG